MDDYRPWDRCQLVVPALEAEVERLQRAIAEHRTAITNAGTIRVDDRDASIAEHKHKLDQWLWAMIQPAENVSEGGSK